MSDRELVQKSEKKKGGGYVGLIVVIALCVLSVPCVGVLAAVAIPAFVGYLARAKTAEATANLSAMARAAGGYYESEQLAGGFGGAPLTACAVGSGATTNVPGPQKTMLEPLGEPFDAIGFGLYDPVYYQYEIVGVGGCGHTAGEALYSFRAYGDLDGDGVTSLFEITATAGADGTLERAPVHIVNETE